MRAILTDAVMVGEGGQLNLAQAVRERFTATGGVDLEVLPRQDMPRTADLE